LRPGEAQRIVRAAMNEKPADALAQHWTDRLPPRLKPFAQLSRLDRPIGWQLLLLPCWMGQFVVRTQDGFFWDDLRYALAFVIGAIAMRGAGCTYNDILDRDIDAKVARTRSRPLPSGAVTLKAAWAWLLLQCLVGLAVLLSFPPGAQLVAIIALPFVALYPLMKRITWWPQAWLGIVFSWGALVGGAAVSFPVALAHEIVPLYVGCFFWVMAYDTIYALQDREDDALIGVRSTARLFGAHWRNWVSSFYVIALFMWSLAAAVAGAPVITFFVLGLVGAGLIWPMIQRIDDAKPETALAAFKANALIGAAVVLALALEPIWRTLRPHIGG
jgi:4-hydroxybenzoate polyprenyltransferase